MAEIVAGFVQHDDPRRERCWIAENDGQNAGSVILVKKSDTVAKLRLLLVELRARGLGLGAGLVDECIRFARQAGYRQMTLWTNGVLLAARHIFARAGFKRVASRPHHSFGPDLVEETWLLDIKYWAAIVLFKRLTACQLKRVLKPRPATSTTCVFEK